MPRVLITGASGLLGRAILSIFEQDKAWEVTGLAFSRAGTKLKRVDLTNEKEVEAVFLEVKPDVVIHSAAQRWPDIVENQPDETKALNEDSTRFICQTAKNLGAWVLYISTDYVFDGSSPPYKETDAPNPLNKYGQSKLAGEKITTQVNPENGVLRIPVLYGKVENLKESAVTILFGSVMESSKKCVMSDYERRFPTHVNDIAAACKLMAEQRLKSPQTLTGTFHWSNNENMTKYTMALAMAELFNLYTNHIEADKNPSKGAPRPYNTQLDCGRLETLGMRQRTPFKDGIKDCLQPYFEQMKKQS